jgi:endonuclease YncB( thermonuclease family)
VPLTIPPNVRHAERFRELSRRARKRAAGLWAAGSCGGDPDRPVG